MYNGIFGFTHTPIRGKELTLTQCSVCKSYFLDTAFKGVCCGEKNEKPVKVMEQSLLKFLMDRRR